MEFRKKAGQYVCIGIICLSKADIVSGDKRPTFELGYRSKATGREIRC